MECGKARRLGGRGSAKRHDLWLVLVRRRAMAHWQQREEGRSRVGGLPDGSKEKGGGAEERRGRDGSKPCRQSWVVMVAERGRRRDVGVSVATALPGSSAWHPPPWPGNVVGSGDVPGQRPLHRGAQATSRPPAALLLPSSLLLFFFSFFSFPPCSSSRLSLSSISWWRRWNRERGRTARVHKGLDWGFIGSAL